MDPLNKWGIGARVDTKDGVVIMVPPRYLNKAEALVFAAYLLALTATTLDEFKPILEAVQNT